MDANSVFLADLRNKSRRIGSTLEELCAEIDPSSTGKMKLDNFRKLVANVKIYLEDDRFLDMTEPYTQAGWFMYKQFIADIEQNSGKSVQAQVSDDQLREFGAPLRDQGVDLIDFLRTYDRNRTGHVPTAIFLRNVSSTPLGQIICRAYTNPVTKDVEYVRLADDLKRVMSTHVPQKSVSVTNVPAYLEQVARTIKGQGIDIHAVLARHDKYKRQRIQPSQFLSEISNMSLNLSPQSMNELADTFTENGMFDYNKFCDEIQQAIQRSARRNVPQQPKEIPIEQILVNISDEITSRHSQIKSQCTQADPHNTGFIAANRFTRLLAMNNFQISNQEVDVLLKEFSDGKGNFDYSTFFSVIQPPAQPQVKIEDLLIRLQDYLLAKRIQLKPKLEKYDFRSTGSIEFVQLCQVLRDIGFDLSSEEILTMKQGFCHGTEGMTGIMEICDLVDPIFEPPKPKPALPQLHKNVNPANVALDVLTKIAAITNKYQIDLMGEFRQVDVTHKGSIPANYFIDIIGTIPSPPDDKEMQSLVNFYMGPNNEVNYMNFCTEMEEFGIRRIVQNPKVATSILSNVPEPDQKVKHVVHRLKIFLYSKKVAADSIFIKYDTNHSGTIPTTRLKPIFDDIGFHIQQEEINDMISFYQDQRMPERFNFKRLITSLNEVQLTQEDLASTRVNDEETKVTTNAEVLRYTGELREKLLARHKTVRQPFVGIRNPTMSPQDFRRCVESFGIIIKEGDMQKILREYRVNMQGDIDWQRFCYDVETAKTV